MDKLDVVKYIPNTLVGGTALLALLHVLEAQQWAPDPVKSDPAEGVMYASAIAEQQIFRVMMLGSIAAIAYMLIQHQNNGKREFSYGFMMLMFIAVLIPMFLISAGQRLASRMFNEDARYENSDKHDKSEYLFTTLILAALVAGFYIFIKNKVCVDNSKCTKALVQAILGLGFIFAVGRLISEWSVKIDHLEGSGNYEKHRVFSLIGTLVALLVLLPAAAYYTTKQIK